MENKENYFAEIKKEINYITAFNEEDENWFQEGIEFLKSKKYDLAEKKFKELVLSQPRHPDGYEGLAYLFYEKGHFERATWCMERAIKLANEFLKDNSIDIKVIEEMQENLDRMINKKSLIKWWEKSE